MAPIRYRMPAIVTIVAPGHWAAWLDPQAADPAMPLLSYPSGQLEAWPVSRRANDARRVGPERVAGIA